MAYRGLRCIAVPPEKRELNEIAHKTTSIGIFKTGMGPLSHCCINPPPATPFRNEVGGCYIYAALWER